jgi:glucose/arabinose dehydrogenase
MRLCIIALAIFGGQIIPASAAPLIQKIGASLSHPWGMDFLDERHLFVTERSGNLYLVDLFTGTRNSIGNLPAIAAAQQGGLLDVAVLANQNSKGKDDAVIYLCYSLKTGSQTVTAIDRARFDGTNLTNRQTIFQANNPAARPIHYGCRLVLDQTYLYASLGDRGDRHDAQDPSRHAGAIIRLFHDGSIPADNPKQAGWAPELFSKGHRNPQGLAINHETGVIWAHEHGPRGGDEINIIQAGHNYGWPKVSHGEEYGGGSIGSGTKAPGLTDPVWVWTPSIAPSGMAFYRGAMFPNLNGHLLVGSLKFKRLYLVVLEKGLPVLDAIMLDGAIGRVRDVAVAADGSVLLLSDEDEGGLFRIAESGK